MMHRLATIGTALLLAVAVTPGSGAELIRPASQRFADEEVREVPDFQRHILPLMGRLGCNSRSCHGSFQGQGGFRLSLFGYDFKMDHEALLKPGAHRVDPDNLEASKVLQKPTLEIPHKGGKRMEPESWQYRMFVRWIEGGAKGAEDPSHFERLEVTPNEIVFDREGQQVPLKVVAHWSDGSREDVTCITRYRTNDESIAEVDADGLVTSKGKGDTHIVAFYDNGVSVTQALLPVSDRVGPNYPDVPTPTTIDADVVAKLHKLGIVPSELCTDAEFLRRASLDLTGTLPTPAEVETFVADPSLAKRAAKVDELLARPSYAAWWTTKLCDITGNSRANTLAQGTNDQVARHWYDWIYRRVLDNTPYDELVAGIVLATSRRPGQSYDDYVKEESAYYRQKEPADFTQRETMPYYWIKRTAQKPEDRALNFSYTFLGVRLECAQCHKHPFDQWTQDDFKQFTAFFNRIGYGLPPDARQRSQQMQEELGLKKGAGNLQQQLAAFAREGKVIPWREVFVAPRGKAFQGGAKKAKVVQTPGRVVTPKVLGGDEVNLDPNQDPRQPLMEWMRSQDNPYFARAIVNRVWANDFGSGIINPPDDMNLANPPSNPALLDHLVAGFLAHNFDMKWLHREIVTSQTYQRSWRANETNRLDERNFSRAVIRRLPAEVVVDAVAQATAASRSLASADSSIETRAIGPKSAAAVGRGAGGNYATKVFGGSSRDTNCDCNRSNEPNLLQSIYMQNDTDLLASIERPGGWLAEASGGVATRAKGKAGDPDPSSEPADALAARIVRLQGRLKEAKEPQAARIQIRLAEARQELKALQSERRNEPVPATLAKAPALDVEQVVREAYLRTLGRRPSSEESEIALAYFRASGDEAKGLRDLLWALLNTKEFITNH